MEVPIEFFNMSLHWLVTSTYVVQKEEATADRGHRYDCSIWNRDNFPLYMLCSISLCP